MSTNSPSTLTVNLPSATEIELVRVFDAPRALVFRAFTDPKLIPRWWGPRAFTTRVDQMDVRPGGHWRYVQLGSDGADTPAFHGEYREIVPPERIVYTFEWEGMPGHVLTDTATFEELAGGKTRLNVRSRFASTEDRDGMIASGMEVGARESYDRMAEVLLTLR
jgi:uncharacterized protein YndB with AHSA1/START domain